MSSHWAWLCNWCSRIGSVVMPWITMAAFEIDIMLPFLIFGFACFLATIASILLPYDTRGRELDQLHQEEMK